MQKVFIALALFCSVSSTAQVFEVVPTEELKKASSDGMLPLGNNYIQVHPEYTNKVLPYGLGLRNVRVGFTLRKLNKDMEVIASREVSKGEKKYAPFLYRFYQVNGNIYLLFRELSGANVMGSIKLAKIDTANLTISEEKELIRLDDQKYRETFYGFFQADDTEIDFHLQRSPKENYSLLFCDIKAAKKDLDKKKRVMFAVFDNKMQLVNEKQHEFNTENRWLGIQSYKVDESGNVHVAYTRTIETPGAKKKDKSYSATAHVVSFVAGKEKMVHDIALKEFVVGAISLLQLPVSGDVVVAGSYCAEYGGAKIGVFRTRIARSTGVMAPVVMEDFSAKVLSQFDLDRLTVMGKQGRGLAHEFREVLTIRDGDNYDLLMEFNTVVTKDLPSRVITTYHSGSILDIYFRGDKAVYTKVPKYAQHDYTNGALSHYHTVYKDSRIFFYNDDKDNLEKDVEAKPSTLKDINDAVLVAGIIKADGSFSRQIIAEPEDKFTAVVISADDIEPLKLLVPMEKFKTMGFSGKKRYLVITIK
jgi:hypothetical protein